jgi:anti-anti-sigma factor
MDSKLTVKVDKREKYAVLYTEGYINNIRGEELSRQFDLLVDEGYNKVIFNFENSKIINSIGISILIEIIEKTIAEKGHIYFCNLTPVIARTFEIMGLTQYAKVYPKEEDAISDI